MACNIKFKNYTYLLLANVQPWQSSGGHLVTRWPEESDHGDKCTFSIFQRVVKGWAVSPGCLYSLWRISTLDRERLRCCGRWSTKKLWPLIILKDATMTALGRWWLIGPSVTRLSHFLLACSSLRSLTF